MELYGFFIARLLRLMFNVVQRFKAGSVDASHWENPLKIYLSCLDGKSHFYHQLYVKTFLLSCPSVASEARMWTRLSVDDRVECFSDRLGTK